jgi:hypothetical protein
MQWHPDPAWPAWQRHWQWMHWPGAVTCRVVRQEVQQAARACRDIYLLLLLAHHSNRTRAACHWHSQQGRNHSPKGVLHPLSDQRSMLEGVAADVLPSIVMGWAAGAGAVVTML